MVVVCAYCYSLAYYIVGSEVDGECLGATCGLSDLSVDLADECSVVREIAFKIERKVVADTLLTAFEFEECVEVDKLVSCAKDE